jgi:hypothetical protein
MSNVAEPPPMQSRASALSHRSSSGIILPSPFPSGTLGNGSLSCLRPQRPNPPVVRIASQASHHGNITLDARFARKSGSEPHLE